MLWEEIVSFLRAGYQVGQVTETWIELWQSFRDGPRAIRQQQTVRCVELCGEAYYELEAEIAVPLHARGPLCASAQLAMGTLVVRGDAIVAQARLPASAVTPAALELILSAIAREAMRLSLLVWERQLEASAAARRSGARIVSA